MPTPTPHMFAATVGIAPLSLLEVATVAALPLTGVPALPFGIAPPAPDPVPCPPPPLPPVVAALLVGNMDSEAAVAAVDIPVMLAEAAVMDADDIELLPEPERLPPMLLAAADGAAIAPVSSAEAPPTPPCRALSYPQRISTNQ